MCVCWRRPVFISQLQIFYLSPLLSSNLHFWGREGLVMANFHKSTSNFLSSLQSSNLHWGGGGESKFTKIQKKILQGGLLKSFRAKKGLEMVLDLVYTKYTRTTNYHLKTWNASKIIRACDSHSFSLLQNQWRIQESTWNARLSFTFVQFSGKI